MTLGEFFAVLFSAPAFCVSAVLICGVMFVNGWTDAPGAITAAVSTNAITMKKAAALAAVFNFVGALVMGIFSPSVMRSVGEITMLIGTGENANLILCAALLSIIIWAILAWLFGIPTSESHALISGILGAAMATGINFTDESLSALRLAIAGLVFSIPIGCGMGFFFAKLLEIIFKSHKIKNKESIIKKGQIFGASSMAFMHGAQDSQKFVGVLIAAMCMTSTVPSHIGFNNVPLWMTVFCSLIIALGTSVGGYRIIKRVGMKTVKLNHLTGLASDISGSLCMLIASVGGIPVSTTHTSSASIIGAGIAGGRKNANISSMQEMLIAWVLTFPCCCGMAYLIAKIFIWLF